MIGIEQLINNQQLSSAVNRRHLERCGSDSAAVIPRSTSSTLLQMSFITLLLVLQAHGIKTERIQLEIHSQRFIIASPRHHQSTRDINKINSSIEVSQTTSVLPLHLHPYSSPM